VAVLQQDSRELKKAWLVMSIAVRTGSNESLGSTLTMTTILASGTAAAAAASMTWAVASLEAAELRRTTMALQAK
jgi:hypothetical protein